MGKREGKCKLQTQLRLSSARYFVGDSTSELVDTRTIITKLAKNTEDAKRPRNVREGKRATKNKLPTCEKNKNKNRNRSVRGHRDEVEF